MRCDAQQQTDMDNLSWNISYSYRRWQPMGGWVGGWVTLSLSLSRSLTQQAVHMYGSGLADAVCTIHGLKVHLQPPTPPTPSRKGESIHNRRNIGQSGLSSTADTVQVDTLTDTTTVGSWIPTQRQQASGYRRTNGYTGRQTGRVGGGKRVGRLGGWMVEQGLADSQLKVRWMMKSGRLQFSSRKKWCPPPAC